MATWWSPFVDVPTGRLVPRRIKRIHLPANYSRSRDLTPLGEAVPSNQHTPHLSPPLQNGARCDRTIQSAILATPDRFDGAEERATGWNYSLFDRTAVRKYIFPGAYVPSLSEVFAATERAGLSVADMEVLRLHYQASALAPALRRQPCPGRRAL